MTHDFHPERRTLHRPRQVLAHLSAGPLDGPPLIFVHGWPALAWTWRHQMAHFAALGYHVVAPDLRGYGQSTVHSDPSAYRQELIVDDMIALLDHLGLGEAVWIGHDWGSPTVWNIAAHFPERCTAAATLAVPFGGLEYGLEALVSAVDRARYPATTHPYGQFDYMVSYEQHPERITAVFDAEPGNTVKALYRKGDPAVHSRPAPTSVITSDGGWFGGAPAAPDLPLDTDVLSPQDHAELTEALETNGFWGPTCYYLNHQANAAYAKAAVNDGRLEMPVLFVGADYDAVADLTNPRALHRMRTTCDRLTERRVQAGHWLQLEAADDVNGLLAAWLRTVAEAPASGS
ncbi:alpha/beta hydrolase [Streptomyces sp. NPDC047079]|uniref:alpha/beta fold hydrolase n=1 Tax=Streptomyces sp. NPDC047079 TaxID=3154607 RepID=UPI0033F4F2D0